MHALRLTTAAATGCPIGAAGAPVSLKRDRSPRVGSIGRDRGGAGLPLRAEEGHQRGDVLVAEAEVRHGAGRAPLDHLRVRRQGVAAFDVLTSPGRGAHLRAVRDNLAARRDALARHIGRLLPEGTLPRPPRGGLNLWLRLPEGSSARLVAERCDRAGLLVSPGDEWFPAEPAGAYVRLNYAGPHAARFAEAVGILRDALAG